MYQKNRMEILEIDSYQPIGWLKDQMELQLNGITLPLDEIWGSINRFSDWIGGTNISWERPPYWLDGLVPLAYLTKSEEGIKKAEEWMEWTLCSQKKNGDFGPTYWQEEFDETLFWPKFVMLKALISYYEMKRESRILDFMEKYFKFCDSKLDTYTMAEWAKARGGDLAYCICWLYEKTGQEWLLNVLGKVNRQTLPWNDYMEKFPFTRPTAFYYPWRTIFDHVNKNDLYDIMKYHATHIVNVTMGLKQPIMKYKETGEQKYLSALESGMKDLKKYHGQVTGVYSGDEHLSGLAPTQGTELCSVVEMMFSLQLVYAQTGDSRVIDLLERVAYNALPATISEDFKSHQYDQQANQIKVSMEERNWYNNGTRANLFGLEPNFGCCLANMHQGWPKFIKNAFFASEREIVAGAYMPAVAQIQLDKTAIVIREETEYPFREDVKFTFEMEEEKEFVWKMRIPGWCSSYQIWLNGEKIIGDTADGYIEIKRRFRNGDQIHVKWEMEVRIENGWYNNGITVERGPLIFALNIKEEWKKLGHGSTKYPDYEIYPKSDWNYALDIGESFEVIENEELARQAFSKAQAPVRIKAWGRKIPQWKEENNSAGELPISPTYTACNLEELEMIPYGCSKLRVALLPWCGEAE